MVPHSWERMQAVWIQILAVFQILAEGVCARGELWKSAEKRAFGGWAFWVGLLVVGSANGLCAWAALPRIDPSGERIFLPPSDRAETDGGLFRGGDNVALLLQPREMAAPIGTEVILVATVLGADRYTSTNERVEWSIPTGCVGEFVQVGKGTWIDWFVLDFTRARKLCNTFAVTSTLRRNVRLTRGTPDVQDDVVIQPGQAWVSISSPMEGTTYVSAYAPSVVGWGQRRQTAVIHWVDAQWTFPAPAITPAGARHVLTTAVVGRSDGRPRRGWLVRYEIVDGPSAGFAPDGAKVVEVATNEAGQASVEIFQPQPSPGTNRIQIQILRPAPGGGPEGGRLLLTSGMTTHTWSAPQLAVRKVGPSLAAVGDLVRYTIDVSNPGDLLAEGVRLVDQIPDGAALVGTNPPGQTSGGTIQWELGTLGPGQFQRVEVTLRADRQGVLSSCAEAISARGLRARQCVSTTITPTAATAPAGAPWGASTSAPAGGRPAVELRISGPTQAVVGQQVRFDIVLTNRGPTAAAGLAIRDRLGSGFRHEAAPTGVIDRTLGDLPPGAEQRFHVILQVVQAGRVCHSVELYSGGQLLSSQEVCLTVTAAPGSLGPPSAAPTPGGAPTPPTEGSPPPGAASSPTPPSAQPPPAGTPSGITPGTPPMASPLSRGAALTVRSWAEPTKAAVGQQVLILSEVQNTGTELLRGVRVSLSHDPQLRPKMATEGYAREGDQVFWIVDQIPPGGRISVQVQYECVQPGTKVCAYTLATTLQGAQGRAEACLTVEGASAGAGLRGPELAISLTPLKDPAVAGENVTYRITVTNQGQKPDFQVVLAVGLPNSLLPNRIGTSGPALCEIEGQVVRFAPVAQIRPGETLTYRIVALARTPGEAEVVAQVQSQSLPQPKTAAQKTRIQPKGG